MFINDLMMNRDCMFCSVQCKVNLKQEKICYINRKDRNGQVKMVENKKFKFITKDKCFEFSIVDKNESKLIIDLFNRRFFCLASINVYDLKNNIIFLHMGFFYNFQRWGKIPLFIPDDIKETIEKYYVGRNESIEEVLDKNFRLIDGYDSYLAYTTEKLCIEEENSNDNSCRDEKYDQNIENEDYEIDCDELRSGAVEKKKIVGTKDTLLIYGQEFCINVSIKEGQLESKLCVEKIVKRNNNLPLMRLAEGTLDYVDQNLLMSKKVKKTLEGMKGYLDLWNQYAEQEGQLLLEKARKVGLIDLDKKVVTYDSSDDKSGVYVPYSKLNKEAEELISNDCWLLFSEKKPLYLEKLDITWNDYMLAVKSGEYINKGKAFRVIKKKNSGFVLALDESETELPDYDYVSLSIKGNETQILRKEDARNRILNGEAANPTLGLILEGQLTSEIDSKAKRNYIMPLSAFVKDKIFKHSPTETQKRAIEIALNTPDIAIIQGPPGTGKTTVITAIIERLNEICNKNENINGKVLISSFQHDAVRNVIERMKINSLPTIKFGKQERDGEEDLTSERIIEEWCEDYITKLNERNPELCETEQLKQLSTLHNIYMAYPSDENAMEFLRCAKKVNIDSEIDKNIEECIKALKNSDIDNDMYLLKLVRKIRTTKEGFMDDGIINIELLLYHLNYIGVNKELSDNKKVLETLEYAMNYYNKEPEEEYLARLCESKKFLLDKFVPRSIFKKEIPDERILDIYISLNQGMKKTRDEKSSILAELLKELRYNRGEVEKSLEHYLFVYAATTQQSEGIDIKKAKGIKSTEKDKHPEYETVIVDEAARVSPSDLMIPLAQAKRRIILVGDHRQLPHIYDEEVFECIKADGENVDINNIKKSMFEYLLERARELEKIDNIQRTIVLDAQYRMHPLLGDFLNNNFYKPYGENFSSPLDASIFAQDISKKRDFPIEWYNFPEEYGKECRKGTSRFRECEADFIVDKISQYLKEEKNLSYGVITFYSEQVKYIKEKLNDKLGDEAKKIRVGSVDAFQGMEFDVIFLSVVRSSEKKPTVKVNRDKKAEVIDFDMLEKDVSLLDKNDEKYKEWEEYRDKVGMQNYGFLISENRLCVALSRQKKLLVVVGNSDIFQNGEWGRIARICVPGMKNLCDLCKDKEVIYDGHKESF